MKRIIATMLVTIPVIANAGEFGGFPGSFNGSSFNGPVNVNNATGNNPAGPTTATSASTATGGTGGLGGSSVATGGLGGSVTGVVGGAASPSQSVNVNGDSSKAYALGMSSLAASANACQGSVAVAFLAFTYTVEFCAALQKAVAMSQFGFDRQSIKNLLCMDEKIAYAASECNK